jgi:ABC-type antimicrobial peptide transport system permease subunit
MQFLIEAIVMTLCGGIIGVIFGTAVTWSLSYFTGWAVKITPFSVILSTLFSAGIGIIFGLVPAQKAAKLNPIQALRYE